LTLSLNQNLKFLVIFDQVVATIRLVKFEAKSFLHFIFWGIFMSMGRQFSLCTTIQGLASFQFILFVLSLSVSHFWLAFIYTNCFCFFWLWSCCLWCFVCFSPVVVLPSIRLNIYAFIHLFWDNFCIRLVLVFVTVFPCFFFYP